MATAAPASAGTNIAVWGNLAATAGSIVAAIFTPDTLMNLLGPKYLWLAPGAIALVNWLAHGMTGNSATSIAPGVVAPSQLNG